MEKILAVVTDMFKDDNLAVSIGMKHRHSGEQTILLGGRIEFNPFEHRRDSFDMMCKYNLWVKKQPDGTYISGSHDPDINIIEAGSKPTHALTRMAYKLITISS